MSASSSGTLLSLPPPQGLACGRGDDTAEELKAVLIIKGVPQAAVQSRAEAAIAKLGIGPIQAALRDKNNWQALKALASRPASRFRWIDYNELQDHIAEPTPSSAPKAKSSRDKVTLVDLFLSKLTPTT